MESKNVRRIFYPQERSPEEAHKKRVAAYCRVSTMSDNQEGSYEIQRAVYTQKITEEPDWTLAGIYADRGISGTQASRRPQFLKLIEDCEAGKIDIVICKSISRFSRNTLDAVTYIQKLLGLGIRLIFEKEGIDTDSKFSEMLITVLAAFAQEESRSLSENVKWGKRKRRKDGECALYSLYGYRKNAEGDNYEIDPDKAAVVRRIFDQYEHGVSVPQIVDGLLKDGIRPPRYDNFGTEKWDESRLHYMIANERYIGDYLTQKYYKKDFMDYRGYRNEGVLPSVYLEDHHDAIVTREQFERCNIILELKKKSTSSQYPFADYLRCPYFEGKTLADITSTMDAMGIVGLKGKPMTVSGIRYILGNESYVGDKLLQKQAPRDFLTKKPDKNAKYESKYLVDDHEAVVSREVWDAVQLRLGQHQEEVVSGGYYDGRSHFLHGRVFCGDCGAMMTRRTVRCSSRPDNKETHKVWTCKERHKVRKGNGCLMRNIPEDELLAAICFQMGLPNAENFPVGRFRRGIERVEVMDNGIWVVPRKAAKSA